MSEMTRPQPVRAFAQILEEDPREIPRILLGIFLGSFLQWLLPIVQQAARSGVWVFPPVGALVGALVAAAIIALVYFNWVWSQIKHTDPWFRFFVAVGFGFTIQAGQQYAVVTATVIS